MQKESKPAIRIGDLAIYWERLMTKHKAIIVRVAEGGVAYANDPAMPKLAAFSFGKIRGYKGQTANELGLRRGQEVTIEYDERDQVNSVLLSPA